MSNVQGVPLSGSEQFEKTTYTKVFWRTVPFLLLCYLVAYLDRVNVGFAKLQMSQDLHFSDTVYGLGAGIFFIAYFIVEVPSNLMLHKVGARLWMARIMITWGLISSLMMFVKTPMHFYIMRFALGLAEAGFYPGVILYLTYWFPANRRGKMMALFAAGAPLSGLIGGPISGGIMHFLDGTHGLAGWQWLFLVEGVPSVIVGIVTIFFLTDGIQDAKWLNAEEKRFLQSEIDRDDHHKEKEASFLTVASNPRVWHMTAIYFCLIFGFYVVGFWLPTLINGIGFKDTLTIGLLTAIPYAAAVVTMLVVARSADKTGERRWHLVLVTGMAAVGLFVSTFVAGSPWWTMIALTIAAAGALSTLPLFWALPTSILGGSAAAGGIALVNSVGNLAGFVGPYALGFIKDLTQSTNDGLYVAVGMLVLGILLTLAVPAKMVNR